MAKNKNPWRWMDTDRKFDDAYVNKLGGKRFFSFKEGSKLGKKLLAKGDIRAAKALFTRAGKAFANYAKYKGFTPKKDHRPTKNGLRIGRNDRRTEPDLEDEYERGLIRNTHVRKRSLASKVSARAIRFSDKHTSPKDMEDRYTVQRVKNAMSVQDTAAALGISKKAVYAHLIAPDHPGISDRVKGAELEYLYNQARSNRG